jgi:hypothetical protein
MSMSSSSRRRSRRVVVGHDLVCIICSLVLDMLMGCHDIYWSYHAWISMTPAILKRHQVAVYMYVSKHLLPPAKPSRHYLVFGGSKASPRLLGVGPACPKLSFLSEALVRA